MERTQYILFLATGRNTLHLMAEGLLRARLGPSPVEILSASMTPFGVEPLAAQAMDEVGVDIRGLPLRTPEDIDVLQVDLVVTLGDFDQSCRPRMPGMPPHVHWDVPEPPRGGDAEGRLEAFRKARDVLAARVDAFVEGGFLRAVLRARRNLELVLENLLDGVLAHTGTRRIFYFNQAAERITGLPREALLGRDCHEVFEQRFCGGNCQFCEGAVDGALGSEQTVEVPFRRPDGEERVLRMRPTPLRDEDGHAVGALISFQDVTELTALQREVRARHSLAGIVGRDPKMRALFDLVREVAAVPVSVLLEGESGTGKEVVAQAIHRLSPRAEAPFVAVNCGALPEGILESELFGHVKGAFTGAVRDKKGRFELAQGGTIFLDEVSELSPAMQVALLRVLQERSVQPVGGEHAVAVDVRVISATNRPLRACMEAGQFRRDLFYRLCVVPVEIPPLRERRLDIPLLAAHFLDLVATETGRPRLTLSPEALEALTRYRWPGNVRELRNAIEYAYVKCRAGTILPEHLPPELLHGRAGAPERHAIGATLTREQIVVAIARAGGNKKKAAELLGVGRATLYRYLKRFGLS